MSRYSKNKTGLIPKLAIAVIIIIAACWYAGVKLYTYANMIDADKIVAQSALKNKKFQADVQEIQIENLSAYLLEEHSNPIVSLSFEFRNAGRAHEAENQQGLTNVLADMMLNGTASYPPQRFKDLCEEYGIRIGFSASKDSFTGSLVFPKKNLDMAVKLFSESLLKPRFDETYFELTKQQLIVALQMAQERPESIVNNKLAEFIYGGHPYSRNNIGREQDIASLTADDLRIFMQNYLAQDNLIVGVAGDMTADETKSLLKNLFGKLPPETAGKDLLPLEVISTGESVNIERETPQAIVCFVAKGTYRNSIDFYPLYMANYIFGESGLSSRLNKNIREKEGLTYGIYTGLSISDASALLSGSYSVAPESFAKSKELLLAEWHKMASVGVTEEELQLAKDALLASFNLRFASIDDISDMLLAMQKYRLGLDFLDRRNDYIATVTLKEVNAAAKKYFSAQPDFVTIGVKEEK